MKEAPEEQNVAAHDTKDGWCCACGYDLIELEKRISIAYQEAEGTKNGVQRYQLGYADGKRDVLEEARTMLAYVTDDEATAERISNVLAALTK